jgi:hypothetical protein
MFDVRSSGSSVPLLGFQSIDARDLIGTSIPERWTFRYDGVRRLDLWVKMRRERRAPVRHFNPYLGSKVQGVAGGKLEVGFVRG